MNGKKPSRPKSSASVARYQLKITLKSSRPLIWRRVVVPSDMKLDRLHAVIQIAMGWTNSHLHQFIGGQGQFDGVSFREPDPDERDDDSANEKTYTVADLAPWPKSKFVYEYDFGDGWLHEVTVEKILAPDPDNQLPACIDGENACPPEDCGGIGGYYDLLKKIANPQDPEHDGMKEWLGEEWDAARFEMDRVNAALKRVKR